MPTDDPKAKDSPPDPPKRSRGRPPKPLPTKPDGAPYTPEEVARVITTTSLADLQQWRENRK